MESPKLMTYEDARPLILTGDLIAVRDVHGLLGRATQIVTDDPHTHTGVAIWLDEHLFMAELNSGRNHLTPLSQLGDFDVCNPPVGLNRGAIKRAIIEWLANPINYGFVAFVGIGIKCLIQRLLKVKLFIHWRKIIVCSGGSVQIFEMAGWSEHSRMVSPGELFDQLPFKLAVRKQI